MLKRYLKETSGNFAMMFAIASTVLVLSAGVAIDIAGMMKSKSRLQSMTDMAVLAASASREDKLSILKKIAQDSIDANNEQKWDIDVKTTMSGDQVITVKATTPYSTRLMGVLGTDEIDVTAESESPLPKEVPVNIALVLDSTKSMEGANMDALKDASKALLAVFDASDPGTIQAGVVPYARWVNVGVSNRNKPWMNVDNDSSVTTNKCSMKKDLISQNCTTETVTNTWGPYTTYSDGVPTNHPGGSNTFDKTTCTDQVYGPEYEVCNDVTSTETWNGCVVSRDDPDHLDPDYKGKKISGIMNESCGSEVLSLTDNLANVESHIDSLVANGSTFMPAGLIWGWRLLDPDQPFGDLTNSQTDRKRAMVLMTDGFNTVRLNPSDHTKHTNINFSGSTAADQQKETNDLTLTLCTGVKDEGIDLYTVAYNLPMGNADAKAMLEECATRSDMYFEAENPEQLKAAFEEIALSLFEVRLSK